MAIPDIPVVHPTFPQGLATREGISTITTRGRHPINLWSLRERLVPINLKSLRDREPIYPKSYRKGEPI